MGNKHNKNVQRGLNEKEVSMLMTNTGLTRPEVEAWHKQFMTEFPSGYIDQKQFVELYKQTYTHGHPEKFAKFAFNAFDHDNSGKISFDEFILITGFVIHKGSTKEEEAHRLNLAFEIFDTHGHGKVDKKDMLQLYSAIAELQGKEDAKNHAKEEVDRIFKENDLDNTSSLNKTEFLQALHGGDVFSLFHL